MKKRCDIIDDTKLALEQLADAHILYTNEAILMILREYLTEQQNYGYFESFTISESKDEFLTLNVSLSFFATNIEPLETVCFELSR